ncbi:hypothetical protein PFISCL1PPCAC_16895 [Pristionchus fissidentatus]|uniref:Ribosomal protein n=1 Tax=Pristionchus fissidentatus TaxID=1538716 RepID=A0AAV5W4F4_9BILA|nr:hypothetical protein PFISCL1PPCAC_16895 [Pristionchus fissidentatus]
MHNNSLLHLLSCQYSIWSRFKHSAAYSVCLPALPHAIHDGVLPHAKQATVNGIGIAVEISKHHSLTSEQILDFIQCLVLLFSQKAWQNVAEYEPDILIRLIRHRNDLIIILGVVPWH